MGPGVYPNPGGFSNINDAKEKCVSRGDCSGITYDPANKLWTLRQGMYPLKSPNPDAKSIPKGGCF